MPFRHPDSIFTLPMTSINDTKKTPQKQDTMGVKQQGRETLNYIKDF